MDSNTESLTSAQSVLATTSAQFLQLDVTDAQRVEGAFDRIVESSGPIRGVVNSAGISRVVPMLQTSSELFAHIVTINLIGTFNVARAAARHLAQSGGGAIVNIASISGLKGSAGRSAYGASKAGVINLTQVMATELAASSIRVNCVAPGPVETAMTAGAISAAGRTEYLNLIPLRRYGQPAEIATAVAFLLDDQQASYITGQILVVDGGFCSTGLQG